MDLALAFPDELHVPKVAEEEQVSILVLGFVLLLEGISQPLKLGMNDLLPLRVC
jgi:hypothetical protein